MNKLTVAALSAVGGFVLGKAAEPIFGGKTARKLYVSAATGALLAKDYVMGCVEQTQAVASDVFEEAKVEVEKYYEENGRFGEEKTYDRGFEDVDDAEEPEDEEEPEDQQ